MKQFAVFMLLACVAVLLASSAAAQEKYMPKISFKLAIISASDKQGKEDIDTDLKDLKEVLVATGYKKFKLVKANDYSYAPMTQFGYPLGEGYQLTMVTMTLQSGGPGVKVSVTHKSNKKKPLIQAIVPLKSGKPTIVDGPKLKDGSVLLLCFIGK